MSHPAQHATILSLRREALGFLRLSAGAVLSFTCVVSNGTGVIGTRNVSNGSGTVASGNPSNIGVGSVANPQFAYVANSASGTISAYRVDATTGALTPVAGSPFPDEWSPVSVTVNPAGTFAYAANSFGNTGPGTVSAYRINARTGALMPVAGSPFAAGIGPASVTVNPAGTFAYVANNGSSTVSAYRVNATTGALTPVVGSPFLTGKYPHSVSVNPAGTFAYVANYGSNTVSAYRINAATGALTPVAGSPFAAGVGPESFTVNSAGTFAYAANVNVVGSTATGTVSAYRIDVKTGALSPVAGSPFAAGAGTVSVTVNPAGTFAYVANAGDGTVLDYRVDEKTGMLKLAGSNPVAIGSVSVTVSPAGTFAYVVNWGNNTVSAYRIDATSGAFTPVAGSPFAAGNSPWSLVMAQP